VGELVTLALRPGTIVIVDDESTVRMLFQTALAARGHTVTAVATVAEGVDTCARLAPDIVIVDIFMPERSGLDLIRAVRARGATTGIIAVTGGGSYENYDVLAAAKDIGADVTLRKPVPWPVLIEAVEGLLG
jgi:two-component system chemotaxis response regulator CheY